MNKNPNVEKQIEELARSFCGFSKTLKCSECSYECHQKEYARKAFEAGYRLASDVAREIFGEIEELIIKTNGMWLWQWDLNKLAELKKKYTQEK
jgi:hypothetical protein